MAGSLDFLVTSYKLLDVLPILLYMRQTCIHVVPCFMLFISAARHLFMFP